MLPGMRCGRPCHKRLEYIYIYSNVCSLPAPCHLRRRADARRMRRIYKYNIYIYTYKAYRPCRARRMWSIGRAVRRTRGVCGVYKSNIYTYKAYRPCRARMRSAALCAHLRRCAHIFGAVRTSSATLSCLLLNSPLSTPLAILSSVLSEMP